MQDEADRIVRFRKKPEVLMVYRCVLLIAVFFAAFACDAAWIDYRFFFANDSGGVLGLEPATAYLFLISEAGVAETYTRIIADGGVLSLDAYATGPIERWESHPFFDFNPEEEIWNQKVFWAIVRNDGYQTGWSADDYVGYSGPLTPANLIGYERNPTTDELKSFVVMWTNDPISLQPYGAIPEPSSALLISIGIGLLGLQRRRG